MVDEKPWYLSKTIWGSLVAIAAAIASAFGMPLGGDLQAQLVEALLQVAGAVGGLVAIYGRLTATDIIS
jgi:hypothetical protein